MLDRWEGRCWAGRQVDAGQVDRQVRDRGQDRFWTGETVDVEQVGMQVLDR